METDLVRHLPFFTPRSHPPRLWGFGRIFNSIKKCTYIILLTFIFRFTSMQIHLYINAQMIMTVVVLKTMVMMLMMVVMVMMVMMG